MTESNPEKEKKVAVDVDAEEDASQQGATDPRAENGVEEAAVEEAKEKSVGDDEWKGRVLYLQAEIENMKKRFQRERSDTIRFANESLLRNVLPVIDNLFLAVDAAKEAQKTFEEDVPVKHYENLLQGVEMTLKHFMQTLEQAGVKEIPSVGEKFNPELHEAVGQCAEDSVDNDVIVTEVQKGFVLQQRVLRSAKVIVNKKEIQSK